jgi:uncharacterized protein HemX
MKKQLIFGLLSAVLLSTAFAQSSGFSRSSKSSATSTSSSRAAPAPKRDYSSSSSYTAKKQESSKPSYSSSYSYPAKKAEAPKPTYGSSAYTPKPAPAQAQPSNNYGYRSTPTKVEQPKPAAPTYSSPYTQPVTALAPKPKAVELPRAVPPTVTALTPAAAALPKSGFSAESKSSTGKKVAAVAGATALGGALYAATANQEAVAAYESAQKDAAAARAPTAAKVTPGPVSDATASTWPAKSNIPADAANTSKSQSQPQVVVVQETPQYRRDRAAEDYAYQRGRESMQREQDRSTWNTPRVPVPTGTYTTAAPAAVNPAIVPNSAKSSGGSGGAVLIVLLGMLVLGAGVYFLWAASAKNRQAKAGQTGKRTSNYNL